MNEFTPERLRCARLEAKRLLTSSNSLIRTGAELAILLIDGLEASQVELARSEAKASELFDEALSQKKRAIAAEERAEKAEAERDLLARKLMEDNTSLEYGHEFPEGFTPRFEPETDSHAVMFWIEWAAAEVTRLQAQREACLIKE